MADLFPATLPAGLPTISLWDPWGSLIAVERKPFETRDWAPPARLIGTRIGIHVAKRKVPEDDLDFELVAVCREALGPGFTARAPLGCMVATAILRGAYLCGYGIEDDTRVTVRSVDTQYDLALIVLPQGNLPVIKVAPSSPAPQTGDKIYAMSGLGSAGASVSSGTITEVPAE